MMSDKTNISILLMAAGSSSRLGQAKQLLPYRESQLINVILEECLQSRIGKVNVVLGAYENEIRSQITSLECEFIINKQWKDGLGKSIAVGIEFICKTNPNTEGVIIVLADQLFVNKEVLHLLVKKHFETKASIILTDYGMAKGPPSFFSKSLFDELKTLDNDEGAKPVVRKYKDEVEEIFFSKAIFDIDTEEDLKNLL